MKARILLLPAMVLLLAADDPEKPEVPELNRKVLEFARDHLGKKVGERRVRHPGRPRTPQSGSAALVHHPRRAVRLG